MYNLILERSIIYLKIAGCFAISASLVRGADIDSLTTTAGDGTVSLVIPNDPQPAWYQSKFTTGELNDPSISGPFADPDHDGLSNMLERFLAFEPKFRNSGYPFPAVNPDGSLSLAFFRLRSETDLDPMVEFSSDLVHWNVGEEFTFVNPLHTVSLGTYDSWEETSKFTNATVPPRPRQFMRVHAVRPSRTNFVDALATTLNDTPTQLMMDCVIHTVPAGEFEGALTQIPRRYSHSVYFINWYFANVGLIAFVDTHKDVVKNYMTCFVNHLQSNSTIRDYLVKANLVEIKPETDFPDNHPSDSDDSYAGTFLGLAARFALKYPSDSWFGDHVTTLKTLAQKSIVLQKKPDTGLVRTYQFGFSAEYIKDGVVTKRPGPFGYLEDNVEVWADLQLFAKALEASGDAAGAAEYHGFCNDLRTAIHTVLWDETNKAWRVVDDTGVDFAHARSLRYYADLQCQMFPQLYGLTHLDGEAEMNRRNDGAWTWLESHKPDWWKNTAWDSHPDPERPIETINYYYSDMALAVVAAKRGQIEHSRSFMAMAVKRWMTDPTRGIEVYPGTIIADIGYWQSLLKGAIAKP